MHHQQFTGMPCPPPALDRNQLLQPPAHAPRALGHGPCMSSATPGLMQFSVQPPVNQPPTHSS
eukprot:5701674-Alexandrium_andersonii.AAC.1